LSWGCASGKMLKDHGPNCRARRWKESDFDPVAGETSGARGHLSVGTGFREDFCSSPRIRFDSIT